MGKRRGLVAMRRIMHKMTGNVLGIVVGRWGSNCEAYNKKRKGLMIMRRVMARLTGELVMILVSDWALSAMNESAATKAKVKAIKMMEVCS